MCLWTNYIFPRWVCLFCWRKYVDLFWEYINRSQTHECGNWGWSRAIPRKGIYKRNCRCSVVLLFFLFLLFLPFLLFLLFLPFLLFLLFLPFLIFFPFLLFPHFPSFLCLLCPIPASAFRSRSEKGFWTLCPFVHKSVGMSSCPGNVLASFNDFVKHERTTVSIFFEPTAC